EVGKQVVHAGMLPNSGFEELGEAGRCGPSSVDLSQHGGKDRRERSLWRCRDASLPDPHHVREQAKGHPRVVGALMLEQQINVCLPMVKVRREQQVAMAIGKFWIDETAR